MSQAAAEAASENPIWNGADGLAGIRAAAATASAAQAAVREAAAPGITERALWQIGEGVVRKAIGGEQVVAEVDLMAGERTELVGAPPSDRVVESGDPVLFDLASRFNGFWANSCATFVCGPPGRELRRPVPGDETQLAAGMTVAVEPGCSGSGLGIRLEHLVLVSEDGCEPLTTHAIELT